MNQPKVVSDSYRKTRQVTCQFASQSVVTRKYLEPSEWQAADSSAKNKSFVVIEKKEASMFRNNRLFVSLVLMVVLVAQPLAAMAQNKTLNSGGANTPANQSGASVNFTKVRLSGDDIAEVSWDVVIPAGVEVQGFEVRVDGTLSNGTAQTDSKSFGGNARFGSFKFNLPLASTGGSKSGGGGTTGTIGPANSSANGGNNNGINTAPKVIETKSGDKTPRKFGTGEISGGNTGSAKPTPTPKLSPPVGNPTPLPRPTPPPAPKPAPKPEPVRITSLKAFITAKFAAGNDLAAFREFIQPTDKTSGEMTPKGGRGTSLQVKKLIHLNEVARLATECPAGQECFDILAELRGADANGQFKVSAEVIFANGVRKNASRVVGNLVRPVRLSVEKVSGQQIANVLVNINGGGNREQFVKTDTQGINILSPVGPIKK